MQCHLFSFTVRIKGEFFGWPNFFFGLTDFMTQADSRVKLISQTLGILSNPEEFIGNITSITGLIAIFGFLIFKRVCYPVKVVIGVKVLKEQRTNKFNLLSQAYQPNENTVFTQRLFQMVAVKQADRQASRILKMRSSKPKNFRIPVFQVAPGGPVGALRRDNRPGISGLHPTADERHGHGQRSAEARTHQMSKN